GDLVFFGEGEGLGDFVFFGEGEALGLGEGPRRSSPRAIRSFSSRSVRRADSTSTKAGSPISCFMVRSARRRAVDKRFTYCAEPGSVRVTSSASTIWSSWMKPGPGRAGVAP